MKTVLIVEDEEQMNNLIKQKLIKLGFNVLQAFDGRTAIQIYENNSSNINMILLDMKLPDIDGSQCITHFRKINKDVRIVICSGMQYNPNEFGATDSIQKPFTYDELKEICNKYN